MNTLGQWIHLFLPWNIGPKEKYMLHYSLLESSMNKKRVKWLIQSSWKANMFLYWIVTYRKKNRAVCFISTAGGHKFPNLLLLYFTLSVSSTASLGPILTLHTWRSRDQLSSYALGIICPLWTYLCNRYIINKSIDTAAKKRLTVYGHSEDLLYEPIFGTALHARTSQKNSNKIGLCQFKRA